MEKDWRRSEIIKGALLFFAIGAAWASLTFQVHSLSATIISLDARIAHMEQYVTQDSKGKFQRQDP